MRPTGAGREGFAIFLVVMVAAVLGVFIGIVTYHGRDTRRKGVEKRDQVQARFLARGAHQHFLLKFKLLPTELYDAVSYAVGKNPFFDFSIPVERVSGNEFEPTGGADPEAGPLFFTGRDPGVVKVVNGQFDIKRSSNDGNVYENQSAAYPSDPVNRHRMEFLLNHYLLDVVTDYPSMDGNGVVVFSSRPHLDHAQMGRPDPVSGAGAVSGWADPFSGGYLVRSARILGVGGARAGTAGLRYVSDSLLITTEASIRKEGHISPVARPGGQLKELIPAREIRTALRTGPGGLELKEERESDAQYKARVESTQRTEISTQVYHVTRGIK